MDIRFDGKVALVTGASTGIGAATAIEFGRSGASVIVNYNRSAEAANEVVETIVSKGGKAKAVQADVSRASEVNRLVKTTLEAYNDRIDILVNNAGSLIERCHFMQVSEKLWDECMQLNIKSVFLCSQVVIPIMKKHGFGRIINISSIAARNGGGSDAMHYASAKAAVLTLTKGLAKDLAQTGITVNNVNPGVITTPFHDRFSPKELREKFKKNIPLNREGEAKEIAYTVLFLASEYTNFILGESIEVNGGQLMD
jgi:3-oxoacyl-[acyl-carrier protein] reductase